MLSKISIANFRGIKQGELNGLGQVNILVGQNNSGKSSVMEALILAGAPVRPIDRLGKHTLDNLMNRRASRRPIDLRELWYKLDTNKKIHIGLGFVNGDEINMNINYAGDLAYMLKTKKQPQEFQINLSPSNNASTLGSYPDTIRKLGAYQLQDQTCRYLAETTLIDSGYIKEMRAVEQNLWKDIHASRKDIDIRKAINDAYGLDIEFITFIPYSSGEYKLYLALPGYSVPIDAWGEGLRYALAILATASLVQGAGLLLEELEVHQHTQSLKRLLAALFNIAKNNDQQLFITTQNLELIGLALEAAQKEELNINIFHLQLRKDGVLDTRSISAPDAQLLMDVGPDIRFLHEYIKP